MILISEDLVQQIRPEIPCCGSCHSDQDYADETGDNCGMDDFNELVPDELVDIIKTNIICCAAKDYLEKHPLSIKEWIMLAKLARKGEPYEIS